MITEMLFCQYTLTPALLIILFPSVMWKTKMYCSCLHLQCSLFSFLRAPGHTGRCVPGCEGPEAGDSVEGGSIVVDWAAGGGPAYYVRKPSAEAAGSGQCGHAQCRTGCGEKPVLSLFCFWSALIFISWKVFPSLAHSKHDVDMFRWVWLYMIRVH